MNIPQGYKQTELGIIPEDWEVISIKERGCLVKDGINPMLSPSVLFWEYSMPAFDNGKQPTLSLGEEMHSNRTVIRDTVLLFNKLNVRQQRVWFVESPSGNSVCSMEFLPYVSKSINLEFLYHYLKTDVVTDYFNGISKGTSNSQKRITPQDFLDYKVILPPIAEQRAIAEALSDVDGLIAALDKKVAKKRLLKQGAMQQLLTGKKRLYGFTDEWVDVQIKELGKWSKGQPFSKDKISSDGKNLCIHYGELFSYGEVIETIKSNTDIKPSVKSSGRDILFPASDVTPIGLGRCSALNMKNVLLGGDIIILELTKDCPAYISYVVNLNKQQIIDRVTGTTVKHINSNLLGEIRINISTDIEEQRAIATILSDMDKEIADLEAQRDKYRLLKSGMMQKLLTGQIRLK